MLTAKPARYREITSFGLPHWAIVGEDARQQSLNRQIFEGPEAAT